jgi:hypothetical protein
MDLTLPIEVVAWSKAWTVFAGSNAGIVVSNSDQGMDVAALNGLIPHLESPTDCI